MNWLRADGTLPDELRELTGFGWSIRELLRGGAFAHDTAVVISIPTFMWSRLPSWDVYPDDSRESFQGAASIVRETQHPYDVILFGHPDLWDDSDMLDRVSSYERLVLPHVIAISEQQRDVLKSALDHGLQLIVTDGPPSRNEEYEQFPESEPAELLEHPNTTVVEGSVARDYWNDEGDGTALREVLGDQRSQVVVDSESPISVTVQTQTEPNRAVVQLVNYDLDLSSGDIVPLSNRTLTVRDSFDFDVREARLYRPGETSTQIEVERSGDQIVLSLPTVEAWGVFVLGPTPDAVSLAGEEEAAEETISEAATAVERVRESAPSQEIEKTEWLLQYARDARRYEAYALAEEYGERATQSAQQFIDSQSTTSTTAQTTTTGSRPSTTTDQDGNGPQEESGETASTPGFGLASALSALALGIVEVVRRFQSSDDS